MSGQRTILRLQKHVAEHAEGWHRLAFEDLKSRLGDAQFPCIFSRNAFKKEIVRFIFVESADKAGIQYLAEGLEGYVELSMRWDGRLDTAYPLVVAFAKDAVQARTLDDYHAFGWRVLSELHAIDPAPWPEHVAKEPDSPDWSMCFNGMPLFCNMSSPAHHRRRSRNLGAHFMIVINPRERFDVFAGDTPSGRKVRANIRDRVDHFDGIPRSRHLSTYGGGALEWLQYSLAETDAEPADRCPFAADRHDNASFVGSHGNDSDGKGLR
ncbi:YqcI/YcgG family protein [Micromonospora sp. NPDC023888]|uniref:YqcI/YcgG family protein n=1 Tax=Micromonospora sp. NPDC023888 TaxID=3155607 RepID=UPI0033DFD81B